jgi:hypothetical protein
MHLLTTPEMSNVSQKAGMTFSEKKNWIIPIYNIIDQGTSLNRITGQSHDSEDANTFCSNLEYRRPSVTEEWQHLNVPATTY